MEITFTAISRRMSNSHMKEMASLNYSVSGMRNDEDECIRSQEHWTAVLVAGAMLSTLSGLGGIVLVIASWLFTETANGIGEIGSLLLVLFFPLAVITAHSLDKIRDAELALRLERCRRKGLRLDDRQN